MNRKKKVQRRVSGFICDVVMLSNAKAEEFRNMTQYSIHSLFNSEKPGTFNILVVEQSCAHYTNAHTLHRPDAFNYNQFANYAAEKGYAPWICIANNDLVFNPGWFTELIKHEHTSECLSPLSPGYSKQKSITSPLSGYGIGVNFSGWCFVIKRRVWEKIGRFDEDFPFWCADDATVEQLKSIGVTPVVVPTSLVKHLGGTTLNTLGRGEYYEKTMLQVKRFNKKYDQNLFGLGKTENHRENFHNC